VLAVRGLRVRYGTTVAVDGLDLDVGSGEAVALLGPNGAGKTSTLHALSRLTPSVAEAMSFHGQDLRTLRADAVARLGLVQAPEGRRIFPNLTAHENLLVGRSARSGRPETFSIDDVYDLFPALEPLRRRAGWALSGGEQQMVAVGRALVAAPRLLLLDEPSLGLAPKLMQVVFDALAQVKERVPVLLVEQNTARALELCDRAYVVARGRIVLAGPTAELEDRETLMAGYLGHGHGHGDAGGGDRHGHDAAT
jgi:branched-chain amino acid transport system ATP-binding protein